MKKLTIGLFGCAINNSNMGCVALSYSLLQLLEDIRKKCKCEFRYIIFDRNNCQEDINRVKKELGMDEVTIDIAPIRYVSFSTIKYTVKTALYSFKLFEFYNKLKQCNVVIDLTEGDSFTDFYKDERFEVFTKMKELVEKRKIPLILGPQTYGPYWSEQAQKRTKNVVDNAFSIYSRDEMSRDIIGKMTTKEIVVATDLAFGLKYKRVYEERTEKIRIGINPSGLLSSNQTEKTKINDRLKLNYDLFIKEIINQLQLKKVYEIHLISHVGNEAIDSFGDIEGVIYHKMFNSPIEAKNLISTMDVFIGSRMHATIAAFSSGVATIPLAYSDKFKGLYEALGYKHTVDLRENNFDVAIESVIKKIDNFNKLKIEVEESMLKVNEKREKTYNGFISDFKRLGVCIDK